MIESQITPERAHALAINYLRPCANSPWLWADNAQALQWRGGPTIAFRQEFLGLLSPLANLGFPPIDAILLLLSACRDGWADANGALQFLQQSRQILSSDINLFAAAQTHLTNQIDTVIAGLTKINQLPPELRHNPAAKATLAQTIFETSTPQLTPEKSAAALEDLEPGLNPEFLSPDADAHDHWLRFCRAMTSLSAGIDKISASQLALRAKTGLDEIPTSASLDIPPADRVRALLLELREDRELAGLVALAGNLMAAVHVPRTLHGQHELPLGGVSDLSNRGSLDRLLISELAHDDEILSIRVALNQAMYLRRESPPRDPPTRRAILIDSGIRAWGIPRVFAAAVALALAATNRKNADLHVFRARRDGIAPVDLTTRPGLIAHLAALETSPHPGTSIAPFFDALHHAKDEIREAILITHEDVLADPDFQKHCDAQENLDWHIAAVSRDGTFRLIHMSRAGQRLISQASMSLEQISTPPEPSRPITPLLSPSVNPRLPLILSTRPFPFLLPQSIEPRLAGVSNEHGLIGITKDGRLMHWPLDHRGGRQLSDVVPRGRVHGILFVNAEPLTLAVIQSAHAGNVVLLAVNLTTGRCGATVLKTTEPQPLAVTLHGDLLLLIYRSTLDAFSCRTGSFIAKLSISPSITWSHGRFFHGNGAFHVIAFDGTKIWLEKFSVPSPAVLRLFDCQSMDGPLILRRDGRIEIPGQAVPVPSRVPFSIIKRVIGISPGGHRIIVNSWEGAAPANFLLDLRQPDGWKRVYGDPAEALLAPLIHRSTRGGVTLRHNFQAIWATPSGELALLSKKDHVLAITLDRHQHMLLVDRGRLDPADGKPLRFSPAAGAPGTRYELGVAAWADGSKAYLDSRGMLHLKSVDPALPEISLVLANGPMAGWSSDFERFGDDFFFDAPPTSTAADFHRAIAAFLARIR